MANGNYQENILTYLKNGNSISPAIAAHEFDCYCLAAVIYKLKRRGYEIYDREIPGTRSKEYSFTRFES